MKNAFLVLLLGLFWILAICCNSKSTNPGPKKPEFALEVSPHTQWVSAGDSTEFKIKLTSLHGFSSPCTLSVVGFPEGDSIAIDSKVLVPPDSSQLTIFTTFSTPRDTYQLTVTGKNKNLNHSTQATLVVPSEKVTDYYPLAIGNSWTYAWIDSNGRIWGTFSYSILDTVTINGNVGYILSDIIIIYVKGDTIFQKGVGEMIVLLGPLVVGQSWRQGQFTYRLMGFEEATLKSNTTTYPNCIKLRKMIPGHPEDEAYEWWAKDVGLVKMEEYISGQFNGSRELVSFTLH